MKSFVDKCVDKSKLRYGAVRPLYGEIGLRIIDVMLSRLDIRAVICYSEVNSARAGTPPSSFLSKSVIQMS